LKIRYYHFQIFKSPNFQIQCTCQSIGFLPSFSKIAFVFENGFEPKKPRSAENGDGCGDLIMKCLVGSIS
jgi:hypothetical protein